MDFGAQLGIPIPSSGHHGPAHLVLLRRLGDGTHAHKILHLADLRSAHTFDLTFLCIYLFDGGDLEKVPPPSLHNRNLDSNHLTL